MTTDLLAPVPPPSTHGHSSWQDRGVSSALAVALTWVALLVLPAGLSAQGGLTLSGGPAEWDLSGTGTGTTFALRWDRSLLALDEGTGLSVEAGVGWFQDGQSGQGAVDLLLPEVGVRIDLPLLPLDLGFGVGWSIGLEDRTGDDPVVWASLGAGIGLTSGWSIRPELRVRAVDPWVGTIADFSLGVRRAF